MDLKGKGMIIGINFRDNDFFITFSETLRLMDNYFKTLNKEPSKEEIVGFINTHSSKVYLYFQNKFTYDLEWDAEKYLNISEKDIFIDDEATSLVKNSFLNSEIYILNTDTSKVYCI